MDIKMFTRINDNWIWATRHWPEVIRKASTTFTTRQVCSCELHSPQMAASPRAALTGWMALKKWGGPGPFLLVSSQRPFFSGWAHPAQMTTSQDLARKACLEVGGQQDLRA